MKIIASPSSFCSSLSRRQDLRLHHHVERRRGLVGDDQRRVARERHRDHHPLLLAPRELVRVVVQAAGGQPDLLEELAGADARLPFGGLAVHDDRLGDLVADPLHRVQRVHGALEDDRRLGPADRAEAAGLHPEHVLAVQDSLACVSVPGGSRRRSAPAIVDLPQPDSPARPST